MPHPAATIVIPVWNQWELTRACLESLRPTLGTRDRVVVVDNGSQDQTPAGLRAYKWVEVITNEANRGFAVASNQGAARAEGEIVVFLNNDTVLTRHWLDALLAPFADPEVGATGPRSNFVSGPQLVPEVGYAGGRMGELRDWAKGWSRAHRGETTDVARLVGFCLAVRKAALDQVGLFDERFDVGGHEDDDLCNRLTEAGWRLVIAHEAFVHHHGHKSFEGGGLDWYAIQQSNASKLKAKRRAAAAEQGALISACMIVKDEERDLPACLASLEDLADEIVVYDTGSSDRTRDIARQAGATVIEGHWDDDFGRARNAALAECTGRWILHIDADEVAHADPARSGPSSTGAPPPTRSWSRSTTCCGPGARPATPTPRRGCSGASGATGRAACTSAWWPGRASRPCPPGRPRASVSATPATWTRPSASATRSPATCAWPKPPWPPGTRTRRART